MNEHIDRPRIVAAVRELLSAVGQNPDSDDLAETPHRVADAYAEFFSGVGVDAVQLLADAMPVGEDTGELVMIRDIHLRSMCEHHLLPFRGRAHIAYRPGNHVVGLGALARVVEVLAARPQLQERLSEEIAETLQQGLQPRGVLVLLEASHGCVADRGVRQTDATAVTIASRGELSDPVERASLITLMGHTER